MAISRRGMLKAAGAAGIACGVDGFLSVPGLRGLAFAEEPAARPLLVVLHLRGGCDGLNLVSPANDKDFVAARASELRVADSGSDAGHPLARGPAKGIDFRLHSAAKGLAELYDSGHLAFVHAAGLTAETRSHFVAIDMIERGIADTAGLGRTSSGWLARHLAALGASSPVGAVSTAPGLSGEFLSWPGAVSVSDLNGGFGAPGGAQGDNVLHRLYAADAATGDVGAAGRTALAAMRLLDGRLARDAQNKVVPYAPAEGVTYDPAGELARPLKTVAQLAKMDVGLEVATVDLGGWDTHEGQQGRFRACVDRLSTGLAAFWNDMAPFHDRLIVLVQGEFGRRLRSNRSGGTDHGRAGVIAVLGGRVAGGRIYGPWPGLATEKLDEGVDLAVTTDYRRVVTEVLAQRTGAATPPELFPGYKYPGPLGLFHADGNIVRRS